MHCILLYSTTFSKLKFKILKNLNTFELASTSFYNWGFPPSHVLSSFSILLHKVCNYLCLISSSKHMLILWLESFQHMWVQSMASSHFHWWFDPQHNMTPHSSISFSNQCKYYLLHLSHGTSVLKPSLALHLRLVPRSPFLAIFTLSSHTQSHHTKHPLKNYFFNIVILA